MRCCARRVWGWFERLEGARDERLAAGGGGGAERDAAHVAPAAHRLGQAHRLLGHLRRADAQRAAHDRLQQELARPQRQVRAQPTVVRPD